MVVVVIVVVMVIVIELDTREESTAIIEVDITFYYLLVHVYK